MNIHLADVDVLTGPKGAVWFSPDRKYRYRLTRPVSGFGVDTRRVAWIMLNPSKADHMIDDLTIRKVIGFSVRPPLRATSIVVVNLFAYIATQPADLLLSKDPFGPSNEGFIRGAAYGADKMIVAWGGMAPKIHAKANPMISFIKDNFSGLLCLGKTASGHPKHPSRLGYDTPFVPWN
jgi:hypothetical protein